MVVRGDPGSLPVDAGGEIADDAAPEKLVAVEREREREGGEGRPGGGEEREREKSERASRSFVLAWALFYFTVSSTAA